MTSRPEDDVSLLGTIAWWERRRLSDNLFLVAIGLPGLLVFLLALLASRSLSRGADAVVFSPALLWTIINLLGLGTTGQ